VHIGSMTLNDFLTKNDITSATFAQAAGLSQSFVHRLRTGEARPSLKTIAAVQKATLGAVAAADWLEGVE
jgi:predicted transcriptional regulator